MSIYIYIYIYIYICLITRAGLFGGELVNQDEDPSRVDGF